MSGNFLVLNRVILFVTPVLIKIFVVYPLDYTRGVDVFIFVIVVVVGGCRVNIV